MRQLYKVNIVFGTSHADLEQWVYSQPMRVRQVRVKDRMESVLRGEEVDPIPPMDDGATPARYDYQVTVNEKSHKLLHDFLCYLDENGLQFGPQLRWLLVGQRVPPEGYVPFKWRDELEQKARRGGAREKAGSSQSRQLGGNMATQSPVDTQAQNNRTEVTIPETREQRRDMPPMLPKEEDATLQDRQEKSSPSENTKATGGRPRGTGGNTQGRSRLNPLAAGKLNK